VVAVSFYTFAINSRSEDAKVSKLDPKE